MRALRGTLTEPGKNSPYRERGVEENLKLFREMHLGKFADGEHVLRAKIDMASPNINMRDPAMYRIRHAAHHRTGDHWRSEEHTSELQSHSDLVCRLLLEKKKKSNHA